jgi:hypothetical protein
LLVVLARGGQFGSDRRGEARILGQAEEEIDAVVLAPMHQLLAGKPGIGAQQDAHPRPAGAEVADDARHLLDRPGAGVDVGTAQFGRHEVSVAEDVKRQVAIVIAVEEAPLLVPVPRVVGGIENLLIDLFVEAHVRRGRSSSISIALLAVSPTAGRRSWSSTRWQRWSANASSALHWVMRTCSTMTICAMTQ